MFFNVDYLKRVQWYDTLLTYSSAVATHMTSTWRHYSFCLSLPSSLLILSHPLPNWQNSYTFQVSYEIPNPFMISGVVGRICLFLLLWLLAFATACTTVYAVMVGCSIFIASFVFSLATALYWRRPLHIVIYVISWSLTSPQRYHVGRNRYV